MRSTCTPTWSLRRARRRAGHGLAASLMLGADGVLGREEPLEKNLVEEAAQRLAGHAGATLG